MKAFQAIGGAARSVETRPVSGLFAETLGSAQIRGVNK